MASSHARKDDGLRFKRLKKEEPAGVRVIPRVSSAHKHPRNMPQPKLAHNRTDRMDVDGGYGGVQIRMDVNCPGAQPAQEEPFGTSRVSSSRVRTGKSPVGGNSRRTVNSNSQSPTQVERSEIDFSTAPSDPVELAIWVAQQICHFGDEAIDMDEDRRRLFSHPPGVRTRRPDSGLDAMTVAELQKVRDENRERKKRWRQSNSERSMAPNSAHSLERNAISDSSSPTDKDNDLRCRLNRRAKTIYGTGPSPEKAAWLEAEFNKRRNKREARQRKRAFGEGEFPGFSFSSDLGSTFWSQEGVLKTGIHAAGTLLANTLLSVSNHNNGQQNADAARTLKAAFEDVNTDRKPFIEALKLMATNPDILRGISAVLSGEGDSEDNASGDENGRSSRASTETRNSATQQSGESDRIKAINAASAILYQIGRTKIQAYVTPYSNPQNTAGDIDGLTFPNGAEQKSVRTSSSSAKSTTDSHEQDPLTTSQVDRLLAMANGGPITHDDDNTITDDITDDAETVNRSSTQPASPKTDGDITATLHNVVKQVLAECSSEGSTYLLADAREGCGLSLNNSTPDPNSIRDQAAQLQSLFTQGGVPINAIIPAAQAQATSQLYAHLSNRARSSTPSGGINPAHANAYGNTAQMNQRMFNGNPNSSQGQPLKDPSSSSRANVVGPPVRAKDPDEVRKIRKYGFPPLPGQKIGGHENRVE
ncbi:hypothetical protein MMC20_006616 [Loxospora ochrophaea]|nr:hypothetical protein [Loxospora ochrophaea]